MMMSSPEQHTTVKDSEPEVPTTVETASSDAMKNMSKEESSSSKSTDDKTAKEEVPVPKKEPTKRFLPAYKKANAALTFPEKMMNLMKYVDERNKVEKEFCVSWLPEGKAFVIYNIKEFTSDVIPKFFKASKFCSFTRKLYRWGFRQLNRGIGPDEPIIFGNEYFQRDNADLMVNMRSITAASIRKRENDLLRHMLASKKRALMSMDGTNNTAYQDSKLNMILNNKPFDQKQQNATLPSAATMASRSGFSTSLSNVDDYSLQMMYESLTNKGGSSSENGMNPILSDAVSQMNNSSYGPSHASDFNSMPSMHNSSNGLMGGASSNYISGTSGMVEANGGYNNLNNGMFSDSMYGSGSNGSRGLVGASDSSLGKSFMNNKHNFHTNGAVHDNGSFGGYTNMPMNMNINQHLFNLSASSGAAGGSDDLYYGSKQY